MAIRKVVLTKHMDNFISDLLRSGQYRSPTEVIIEGLRLLEQREAEQSAKLNALRQATSIALMALEQGRYIEVSNEDLDQFLESIGTAES